MRQEKGSTGERRMHTNFIEEYQHKLENIGRRQYVCHINAEQEYVKWLKTTTLGNETPETVTWQYTMCYWVNKQDVKEGI
jgi:hypothetical protein